MKHSKKDSNGPAPTDSQIPPAGGAGQRIFTRRNKGFTTGAGD
jgi:hypothetical protein